MLPGNGARKRTKILKGILDQNRQILGLDPVPKRSRSRVWIVVGAACVLFTGMFLLLHSSANGPSVAPPPGGNPHLSGLPATHPGPPVASASRPPSPALPGSFTAALSPSDYLALAMTRALPVRRVLGLGVKTIMIDAGHGGKATGTTGAEGTHEKDITLDIARRLRQRLSAGTGYNILVTRDFDRDCSLRERVERANIQKADLFISIHVNSLPQHSVNIVETYFFGPTTDRNTLRLAATENQDSDYAISDFDAVVGRIANRLKFEESSRLAHVVHQSIFSGLKARNPALRDCGVKRAPFVILLGVDMPGILVEVSCMSNREEERKLRDSVYRERIAGFIEQGIINYLNQRSGS